MIEMPIGVFADIVARYYPGEALMSSNGSIIAGGYLGKLIKHLKRKGYARKFEFIKYLIEHVDYQEAIDRAEDFIEDLMGSGIIYRDAMKSDLFRVSPIGVSVFAKIKVRS
jgi:hypothetical protein